MPVSIIDFNRLDYYHMMRRNQESTLFLSSADVQSILMSIGMDEVMDHLINDIEKAISKFNSDRTMIPTRSGFNYSIPAVGLVEWMPLYQKGDKVTLKLVGYHPNNPSNFNLPTIISTISQYDTKTGHLIGIMDGVLLTALRTGAASAIATNYMSSQDSEILGIIGCGAQAVTQIHAISRVRNIKKVLYFDVDEAASNSLKERSSFTNPDIEFECASIETIVEKSDIISTATSIEVNQGPLFHGLKPKPHLHINAVGSDFPGKVEIPRDIIDQSILCPDFLEQALVEGECQQVTREDIQVDLTTLVKSPTDYLEVRNKLTVFDSTGWALEDHVSMNQFLQWGAELNVGHEIELEFIPEDAKSPYEFLGQLIQS